MRNRSDRPASSPTSFSPRVLLVAENISLRLSGETLVPYYYMQGLKTAGFTVRAICHARVRDQLREDLDPAMFATMTFVEDSWLQRRLFAVGRRLPYRVEDLIINQLIHILTQIRMRGAVRRLISDHHINVVFEPAPIAPTALSFLYGLPAPVVIGPMSGGMDLPPAFRDLEGPVVRTTIRAARAIGRALHRLVPGKPHAAALLVANAQTRKALPSGIRGTVHTLFESGVELARWTPRPYPETAPDRPVRFIFCSRFVDWKGIGYLVDAFLPLAREGGVQLDLVGDGELFDTVARQVAAAGVGDAIHLHGRLPLDGYVALLRDSDVYVTPSLRECGGMAMLEAMAVALPVIGVDWGGAAQYTTPACALLVAPTSKPALVEGLRDAMRRMARSYDLRRTFGQAARQHLVDQDFAWQARADRVASVLREVMQAHDSAHPVGQPAERSRTALQPTLTTS